jgi:hypothetical protein
MACHCAEGAFPDKAICLLAKNFVLTHLPAKLEIASPPKFKNGGSQ